MIFWDSTAVPSSRVRQPKKNSSRVSWNALPVKKIFLDCLTPVLVTMMSRNVGEQLPTYVAQHHRTAKASRSLLFSKVSPRKHFFAPINIQHARGNACGPSCTVRKLIYVLYDGCLVKLFDMKYVTAYSVKFFMLPTVSCVTP